MVTRTDIAEQHLRLIRETGGHQHVAYYVRLAAREGVPFGRIVMLSGLSPDTIAAVLEGE